MEGKKAKRRTKNSIEGLVGKRWLQQAKGEAWKTYILAKLEV